jgi:cell division protein FtsW
MKKGKIDYILVVVVAILLIFGILLLSGVSAISSQEKLEKATYYLFHQIIWGLGIGIFLGFIAFKIPLSVFKKGAWVLILINLIFMILVFVPKLSIASGGAPRWINFGFFTFQPSETLKLAFILYLSAWLASRRKTSLRKNKEDWKIILVPFLLVLGLITFFLTYQSDISTLAVIVIIGGLMYFLANFSWWHTVLIFSVVTGGLLALIRLAPYRIQRILVFLQPEIDPMGIGYQIKQALIAIGSGGISGLGFGMSKQKFGFLPQTMSDSVFAIFAEEAGFIGATILIILFLIFLWRGFRIAKNSKDKFSQFFALGISIWICVQAFVNIGAMIGILPLTGIPLPLISYGGSHMVAELIGVGILLNISKSNKK